jgi:hypothetical protein
VEKERKKLHVDCNAKLAKGRGELRRKFVVKLEHFDRFIK